MAYMSGVDQYEDASVKYQRVKFCTYETDNTKEFVCQFRNETELLRFEESCEHGWIDHSDNFEFEIVGESDELYSDVPMMNCDAPSFVYVMSILYQDKEEFKWRKANHWYD